MVSSRSTQSRSNGRALSRESSKSSRSHQQNVRKYEINVNNDLEECFNIKEHRNNQKFINHLKHETLEWNKPIKDGRQMLKIHLEQKSNFLE